MDPPLDRGVALETRRLELTRPPRERRDREVPLDRGAVGVAVEIVVHDRAVVAVSERAVVSRRSGLHLHVEPTAGTVAIRPERRDRRDHVLGRHPPHLAQRGGRPRAGGVRASRTTTRLRTRPGRTAGGGAGCRTARARVRRARHGRARTGSRRRRVASSPSSRSASTKKPNAQPTSSVRCTGRKRHTRYAPSSAWVAVRVYSGVPISSATSGAARVAEVALGVEVVVQRPVELTPPTARSGGTMATAPRRSCNARRTGASTIWRTFTPR